MKDDDLEKLKSLLQNKALLTEPDRTGLLPLDKAVILGQTDILEYLVIKHDDVLNLTDNVSTTFLWILTGTFSTPILIGSLTYYKEMCILVFIFLQTNKKKQIQAQ